MSVAVPRGSQKHAQKEETKFLLLKFGIESIIHTLFI